MAFQSWEILLIVLVVILLFGGAAIPKLARSLGRAKGEFSKAKREFDDEAYKAESDAKAAASPKPDEEAVRRAARDLGIAEKGLPIDEVKRLVNEKLA